MYTLFSSFSENQVIDTLILAEQEMTKRTDGKVHVRTKMQSRSLRL